MSKKTTERIKVGWKITQQNPDKFQNVKWLFPGRALPKTKHQIYFIILKPNFRFAVHYLNWRQQKPTIALEQGKYSWKSHEMMVFDEFE